MKKIMILSTGGTISTKYNEDIGGLIPTLEGEEILNSALCGYNEAKFFIRVENILKLNSNSLMMNDLMLIRRKVRESLESSSVDGVIVIHGTGMMEETAYFLDISLDICKPVVFTGAQRDPGQADSDSCRNILDAINVASHPGSVGQGVLVVFNGEIHAARNVTKQHTYSLQAFKSTGGGCLGNVFFNKVTYHQRAIRSKYIAFDQLVDNVDLIKFTIGADARYINCSIDHEARGIIIEASGTGNVNIPFYKGIQWAVREGLFVGIASRVSEGGVSPIYANDGGGASLEKTGAIMMSDLSGQKARILAMVALSGSNSTDEAKEICLRYFL